MTTSYKTLLRLFFLAFLAFSNMSSVNVFGANKILKQQSGIVIQFAWYSIADYVGFLETLNSAYDIFIEGADFDSIWVDLTTKKDLRSNAVKLIEVEW